MPPSSLSATPNHLANVAVYWSTEALDNQLVMQVKATQRHQKNLAPGAERIAAPDRRVPPDGGTRS